MLFKVTAAVDSNLLLPAALRFQVDEFSVTFRPNSADLWTEIEVVQRVVDYESLIPVIGRTPEGLHHIDMRGGDLFRKSVDLIQYIESLGSFWIEVRKIDWPSAEFEWLAENDAEKDRLEVFGIKTSRKFPEPPKRFEEARLAFLSDRARDSYLTIPMSFFREGMNDFRQFRFINAFFSFYFFLEGLYGQGKTKNRQVVQAFKQSRQLKKSAEQLLANLKNAPKHCAWLEQEFGRKGWTLSADRLFELLVGMRGQLHHFSIHSSQTVGHPLNQADFETIAFVAMQLCVGCYAELGTGTPPS